MEAKHYMVADVKVTESKLRIMALLACGQSQKQVADLLQLSPGTVKNYIGRLRDRFGGQSTVQLIVIFAKAGLDTQGYFNGHDLLTGLPEEQLRSVRPQR
jgi:DNA-binding CsgD family transcriptional regulator